MGYSKAVAEQVLKGLAGGKSLRRAAADAGTSAQSILRWCEADPEFAEQYARARANGFQLLADEILEISDEAEVQATYKGDVVSLDISSASVQRNRLRVDSRKWLLSKMLPKTYGDKVDLGGEVGINHTHGIAAAAAQMTDAQLDEGIRRKLVLLRYLPSPLDSEVQPDDVLDPVEVNRWPAASKSEGLVDIPDASARARTLNPHPKEDHDHPRRHWPQQIEKVRGEIEQFNLPCDLGPKEPDCPATSLCRQQPAITGRKSARAQAYPPALSDSLTSRGVH